VKETAMAIAELLSLARAKPLSTVPFAVPLKTKSLLQEQLYLVSSMPGVGRKLAERLLMKYETPRRVMSLTVGELALTQGIGWKRADKIKELLDTKFTRSPETKKQMRLEE
jgi:DNA excision repair protein ERCC-4